MADSETVGWRERMSRALDMPPDLLGVGELVEIRGRRAMTIHGGGRILMYTPEQISVALGGKECLTVKGRGLVCTSYYARALGIEGHIEEVVFGDMSVGHGKGGEQT